MRDELDKLLELAMKQRLLFLLIFELTSKGCNLDFFATNLHYHTLWLAALIASIAPAKLLVKLSK